MNDNKNIVNFLFNLNPPILMYVQLGCDNVHYDSNSDIIKQENIVKIV